MKQKFIELRRSMNLQLGIWGSIRKFKPELRNNKVLSDQSCYVSSANLGNQFQMHKIDQGIDK